MLEGQVGAFGQEMHVTDEAWRRDGMLDFEFQTEDAMGQMNTYNKFLPKKDWAFAA